ncbi:hypothetical protein IT402_02350 [Candidatus Nomurabacteria bacterium]|nr:hypothetical protein [Candidatus Nomurabacteria bacterium]
MGKEIIGVVAGGVSLIAYGIYIYTIWWGKTKPSRSSWWILSIVWTIVLFSSFSLSIGETEQAKWAAVTSRWLSISYIIGSLGVAVSSIWRGASQRWKRFDYFCASSAGFALFLYFFTNNPLASLIFGILADFFGLLPTIKNAQKHPEQENLLSWVITVISCILALFAVSKWSFSVEYMSDWSIPVYLTVVDLLIVIFILRGIIYSKRYN